VDGTTLDKYVAEHGKPTAEQSASWALQTAEGLDQAHQANLFHGLLKPSNLMIGPEGQVRILDFGIGCLLAETEGESLVDTMSTANSVNSGLDCASPESIMDPTNLNASGDQYSLGCVIYWCLTGQYPFPDGTAVEKMMAHQHKQPKSIKELIPDVSDALLAVVEQLMQKNPANRFANFAEVIAALRPLTGSAGAAQPQRRATMVMPRVRLPRPGAPEGPGPIAGSPSPTQLPRGTPQPATRQPNQPLPPRSPSALAGATKAPEGGRLQRPADRLPIPPRKPVEPPPENVVIRHPPPVQKPEPAVEADTAPQSAEERAAGFGLVTVILLAALAGAAAFFLSKLIPF